MNFNNDGLTNILYEISTMLSLSDSMVEIILNLIKHRFSGMAIRYCGIQANLIYSHADFDLGLARNNRMAHTIMITAAN